MTNEEYFTQLEILEDLREAITDFEISSYAVLIYTVLDCEINKENNRKLLDVIDILIEGLQKT